MTAEAMLPNGLPSSTIESLREWLMKNVVTGFNEEDQKELQWDIGLDTRFLFLEATTGLGAENSLLFVPMLSESQFVLAYGDLLAYGSFSLRRVGADRNDVAFFSRYHWLKYQLSESASLRIGRMVLPFGIQSPDHTLPTRRNLGFNKYDQSYGLQFDFNSEFWSIGAMAFFGENLIEDQSAQERGAAASIAYLFPGQATIGVSLLASTTELYSRFVGGVFSRIKLIERIYVLAESDIEYKHVLSSEQQEAEWASYLRIGWFPWEWLDIYGEFRYSRLFASEPIDVPETVIGVNWQVLPWVELIPMVRLNHAGSEASVDFMGQLHVLY